MPSSSQKSLRDMAKRWVSLGLSVVPIKPDGTKSPAIKTWTELQERVISDREIDELFKPGLGIGIIAGEISGNLEILDFDVPETKYYKPDDDPSDRSIPPQTTWSGECVFDEWFEQLDFELFELVESIPRVMTPGGGVHLYYRCSTAGRNQKLAGKIPPEKEGLEPRPPICTLIETRANGGYVVAPGSPPACHPDGKTYDLANGSIEHIPVITPEQRDALFRAAKSFDESGLREAEKQKKAKSFNGPSPRNGKRPGDDFNRRVSWADILEPLGWTLAYIRRSDGVPCWRRPGKSGHGKEKGISATVIDRDGIELFHCFSSNGAPFPLEESITKFTAYALIHHDGDYEKAARDLGKQGYGEPPRSSNNFTYTGDGKKGDDVPWSDEYPGIQCRVIEAYEWGNDTSDVQEISSPPFPESVPPESSILNEEMDPLDVQLFEDEERLRKDTEKREAKRRLEKRILDLAKGPAYIVWRDAGDPPKKEIHTCSDGVDRVKTNVEQPRHTAWHIINDIFSHDDGIRNLHYQHGEFMQWNGQRYRRLKADDVRPQISRQMTHFAQYDGEDDNERPTYKPFSVRSTRVDEMVKTTKEMTHIDSDIQDPCWLCDTNDDDMPDSREIVCCQNGLLDISTRELIPPTAAFYSFTSTGIVYDPAAGAPKTWLKFLDSTLDAESKTLLQEWFGYCLVTDTRLQKLLMIVGKPGSGKGTAMSVLQWLIGEGSYCSMAFDRIDDRFSLQLALGKSLMIFPDARQGYKADKKGGVVGTLLSISGEDDLMIDRKNMKPVTQKLNTRIVIVSNDILSLSDPSGALNRRMLWIKFPGFSGEADSNLKSKLKAEMSGILNWAIEGWHRIHATGSFTQPASAENFIETFQEQASPIKKFIEDMCVVDPDAKQDVGDIYRHWNIWRKLNGYGTQTKAAFGKQIISADMSIRRTRVRAEKGRKYIYEGIQLDAEKVEEFVTGSVSEEEWDKAREEISKKGDGDIITISEWVSKNKNAE